MLIVDGIDCQIREPHPYTKKHSAVWFSAKFKGPGLRYEVASSILGGDICWVNGPFPCGSWPDWKIFNEGGLRSFWERDERVEADDGYRGGDPEVTKTRSSIFVPPEAADMRNRVRARHEVLNGKLKSWKVLSERYRSTRSTRGLGSHQDCFFAVAVITQFRLRNGEIKIFSCDDYDDTEKDYRTK